MSVLRNFSDSLLQRPQGNATTFKGLDGSRKPYGLASSFLLEEPQASLLDR